MEALHESLAHEFPTSHAPSSHSPVTSTLPKRGNFRDHYRFFPSSGQLYSFSRKPHFSRSDSNRGPLPELARGPSREIEMSSSLGTLPAAPQSQPQPQTRGNCGS
ncbi:Eukaryotic translation initiation factor 4E type 2 [Fusarium oxysporum f. sp. albedinis]|nr:Eukaryotic translation initiation factor 4E type 2 [Fusarium oxysporum f. sp. albedinis]